MAMGRISLVEETEGVKEILTDGKNSILYKNPIEFEEKVLKILHNPKLRKKIEKEAETESRNHTWDKRAEEFEDILKDMVNRK